MFQRKLEELRQQFSRLQEFSHGDPGQVRELMPGVLAGLQQSLEELHAIVAELPQKERRGSIGSTRSNGRHSTDARPGRGLRFRAMAERSPVLVRIMSTETRCRWVNRAWLEFTGRSMKDVLGEGWLQGVHPEDRSRCAKTCHEGFDSSRLDRVEYRLQRKNGEYGWVFEIGTPRLTSRGSVSGYLGTAIEITEHKDSEQEVRLYQERLRTLMADLLMVEEHERRRLAVDLHDGLSQTIALAQIKLSSLRASLDGKQESALDEIEELINQTNRAARSISFELSPPVLHDLGLEPAVQWLVENIQARYGIEIVLQNDSQPKPADEKTRVILFRSIRELLINAAKHAGARRVHVRLEREENHLNVAVEDDGIGMESDVAAVKGSGLFSIHERLNHVGGSMRIESAPGKGTKIRLCAPLANGRPTKAMVEA